ncbi:bromodomain adjacent to zinc finger domain protein 2B isoform X4 [Alosa sapidissima]|uniref:bromodomain adjacent to zinc finger domain protein 2B isoform X4 n=1 Tax=Alosa sapidissima TaxID=34773 RepID=UPI001C09F0BA|nr:bromodomain adjacent to zinc finger domain protein 2B isoform X4 [Alosa sapidissima]
MESGERLASPSSGAGVSVHAAASAPATAASSSSPAASSPASSSSPATNAKSNLGHAASAATLGPLFGGGEQAFGGSSMAGAFPLLGHPAFGLLSPGSARPEFGGLGALGVTAALAAHPQLGAFTEWWRATEAHGHTPAAFFPPFLGLPHLFAPPLQNHEASPYQSRTPSKSSRTPKGVNGAVNGSVVSSSSGPGKGSISITPSSAAQGPLDQARAPGSKPCGHKSSLHNSSAATAELLDKSSGQKPKEKKLRKKAGTGSAVSDSESGSSDSDLDGVSSSDLDDLGEEDEDDDEEDDDDQSKESDESDYEKERQKKKAKLLTPTSGLKKDKSKSSKALDPPTLLPSSPPLPLPPAHTSVIQAIGLAASTKPLALVAHPRGFGEGSPKQQRPPLAASPSSSAKPRPSSPQHAPLSLCSSPKPLSVPSPPRPMPHSSSPKPPSLSPSPLPTVRAKPQNPSLEATASRKLLEASLAHLTQFRFKQSFLSQEQAFPLPLKRQSGSSKSSRRSGVHSSSPLPSSSSSSTSSSLPPPKLTPEATSARTKPPPEVPGLLLPPSLLGLHPPNGVIQHPPTQDAPLALTTKPRTPSSQQGASPYAPSPASDTSLPVNLSTGSGRTQPPPATLSSSSSSSSSAAAVGTLQSSTPLATPAAPSEGGRARGPRKSKTPKALGTWKGSSQNHLAQSLVDLFQHGAKAEGGEPAAASSKDSDDSGDDDDDEDDDLLDEEDEDEEDSEDSLSESDSNSDGDVNGSEKKKKKSSGSGSSDAAPAAMGSLEGEKTPLKLTTKHRASSSANHSLSDCSPLNLQVIKPTGMATPTIVTSAGALTYHSSPSSSYSVGSTPPGSAKRKRVISEEELRIPLEMGWQRETRIKMAGGRLQGDVAYYAPCGKRLRQYPDVVKYLSRNGIADITRDNFSFSAKIRVGDFYEARDGPQGLQWCLLKDEEVIPRLLAMEGRRGRPPNSERLQRPAEEGLGSGSGGGSGGGSRRRKGRPPNVGEADFPSPSEAKLLRKLEAQEIARQAAQMKLMRKLEKQALARAAKEARKQQAIMAAEERRKQKEQIKILKQQEKIKRIQQIRMEKELRAQQILEAKRKKREEAANAKILEAEKRIKEKEMRRQQAIILKHQERERRRQHVMLMKAVEARKKAEERERLRQEKRDEKRLKQERKMELRRLELEIAREMKKPNEDMCLADHKPMPELSRIPGLVLPGLVFSDCLMVVQFLRAFGRVLGMETGEVPTLGVLQEGLLNLGNSMGRVQDLLVRLLSAAISDPGLPPGHKSKTILGESLANVGLNRDNVSEVLQIYLEAQSWQAGPALTRLAQSMRTKAFQAHTPAQKASILAFLVNELACSKSVVSEIDKSLDHMTVMRRDELAMEVKLKKLKIIHAKRTGKREVSLGGEEPQSTGTPTPGSKRKRKGDSEDEDEEDEESDEAGDEDEEEEEEEVKKVKKVETCDEDETDQATSVEELEKQIEKLAKQQNLIRKKLFEASHSLRSMMYGQDRYRRRYWVLPQCGGVYVEALESGEGPEELEKERERLRSFQAMQIKEEPLQPEQEQKEEEKKVLPPTDDLEVKQEPTEEEEEEDVAALEPMEDEGGEEEEEEEEDVKEEKPAVVDPKLSPKEGDESSDPITEEPQQTAGVLLPHPSSPLTAPEPLTEEQLPEASSQVAEGSPPLPNGCPHAALSTTVTCPSPPDTSPNPPPPPLLCSSPSRGVPLALPPAAPHGLLVAPLAAGASIPGGLPLSQQPLLLPSDQLMRVLTERGGHWFSLLPRAPCDDTSLTTPPPGAPRITSSSADPLAATTSTTSGGATASPSTSAALPQPKSPPSCSPNPHAASPLHSLTTPASYSLSPLQVTPGMGLPMCSWSGGLVTPHLPLCSSPLPHYPSGEGSASPLLPPSVCTSLSGSPAPHGDKPTGAMSPVPILELSRPQDHPTPQPIPEDKMLGWWKLSDMGELKAVMASMHSRGIREKSLQKQLQKNLELITQTCNKNKEVAVMEVSVLDDEGQVSEETVQTWCVEEQAMETDIALLVQVEELEKKVTAASLQVKGWMFPETQSEREDLVYYEHKSPSAAPSEGGRGNSSGGGSERGTLERHLDNPLDIAVTRLAELECHIERRYLQSPLGSTIQIKLDNVGTVTVPGPALSTGARGEGSEEEVAPGLKVWRKALSEVRSSSQLAMCLQQLQKSIAWERSIMKVYCQICRKGDNDDLLLLCDGCDKGCHTYCHKPKIFTIPEGDWYCPACITKASTPSPNKNKKPQTKSSALAKKSNEGAKRNNNNNNNNNNNKQPKPIEEAAAAAAAASAAVPTVVTTGASAGATAGPSTPPKKGAKDPKKSSPPPTTTKQESPVCVKRAKTARDNNRDLGLCRVLLAELERHQDAWPFLTPVNQKSVPGYRKVIKKPMDFSTIREKLVSSQYQNLETFIIDVNLVFDNCEKFNEDNSDIGRAGHNMRKFFEKRWTELLKQTN